MNVVGDAWNEEQRKELSNTLREEFGMLCVEFGEMAPNMPMEDSIRRERGQSRPAAKVSAEPPLDLRSSVGACRECNAMFVQETVRNGLKKHFDWSGHKIEIVGIFEDGIPAFEYMKTHEVDIIITDVRMIHMDGITLAQKASVLYPEVKVLFISGYADVEYLKEALQINPECQL